MTKWLSYVYKCWVTDPCHKAGSFGWAPDTPGWRRPNAMESPVEPPPSQRPVRRWKGSFLQQWQPPTHHNFKNYPKLVVRSWFTMFSFSWAIQCRDVFFRAKHQVRALVCYQTPMTVKPAWKPNACSCDGSCRTTRSREKKVHGP